jgi:hypothetical protein
VTVIDRYASGHVDFHRCHSDGNRCPGLSQDLISLRERG